MKAGEEGQTLGRFQFQRPQIVNNKGDEKKFFPHKNGNTPKRDVGREGKDRWVGGW